MFAHQFPAEVLAPYDLVIKGGEVIDPAQGLRGKRDIGIRFGKIAAVADEIAAGDGKAVIDASGKLVTPGLIDLHAHVYAIMARRSAFRRMSWWRINAPPRWCRPAMRGRIISRGCGASWRRNRARGCSPSCTIANQGLAGYPISELPIIDYARVDACARALAENPDFTLGVKVRMSENIIGDLDMAPLERSIKACEISGRPAKIMVAYRRIPHIRADGAGAGGAAAG